MINNNGGKMFCPPIGAPVEEIVAWVHQTDDYMTDEECVEAHRIYRSYVDEGQRSIVARQYAGLSFN